MLPIRAAPIFALSFLDLPGGSCTSESEPKFMLNEAKNVGDALASAKLFDKVQHKICCLPPFDDPAEQVFSPKMEVGCLQGF